MGITRWTPRIVVRVVAAGVVLIAMSLVSGTESSASEQVADATLTYACPFHSGTQQITVKVAGTFPGTAAAGEPVQPGGVRITSILPQAALADLDAASVTASARLSVAVAQDGSSTDARWPAMTAPSAAIPDSGDLTLSASGAVPSVTLKAVGAAAFIAGPLTLVLTPHTASGEPTDPATVSLACTLELDQNAVLATVLVSGPGGSARPVPGTGKATRHAAPKPADDDPCILSVPGPAVPGEAFLAGFSNVDKLHGATLLGRENGLTTGHTNLVLGVRIVIDLCSPEGNTDVFSQGVLDDNGKAQLPPAKATFLTFGFMPTTATLELTAPAGTDLEIDSHSFTPDGGSTFVENTTITSQLSIRVHDVLVNGVPLDVGPHCESATPMTVILKGESPEYTVNTGGPLTGTAKIPPFSGCGVGEDLDPLFTASISGPGNFMKLIQGVPCRRPPGSPPLGCDPIQRPDPQS